MNIKPIHLLKGTHSDTAQTGQGCFMNVIAYLNGESQITDTSPCVCVTVRPLAIKLNDLGTDDQRQRLLPFVLRAMGSATQDAKVLDARVARLRKYDEECAALMRNAYASDSASASASAYASADALMRNAYANASAYADAYASAYDSAYAYADASASAVRASLFDAGLRYLNDVLPPAEPANEVTTQRLNTLQTLQTVE